MSEPQPREYTGQLIGGPDEGNLVTATAQMIFTEVVYRHHLEGPHQPPEEVTIFGWYTWNEGRGCFLWERDPHG